ncbi:MAG: FAD-dependent oxidoreductase [Calditrichaeota bacterium]|nr:MAG: FAD-dependent oxidoreductase [Calditrichota bacterium]
MQNSSRMNKQNVVIIGAGLAGLTCAVVLRQNGLDPLVIEKSERIGGRIKTDKFQGFLLDHGFQVLLTAYPETKRFLDYQKLNLGEFYNGAVIWTGRKLIKVADPARDWKAGIRTALSSKTGNIRDKLRLLKLRSDLKRKEIDQILNQISDKSTREAIQQIGFSDKFVKRFLSPFMRGIFLEKKLSTSAKKFEFVFKMFSQGTAALPDRGMAAVPEQLASKLTPQRILLNTAVRSIRGSEVILEDGKRIHADAIVIATDANDAFRLLNKSERLPYHAVTCMYYSVTEVPVKGSYLFLNGSGRGSINNICFPSEINAGYAAGEMSLASVTLLEIPDLLDHELEEMVYGDLKEWFGDQVDMWELLKVYKIPQALPEQDLISHPDIPRSDAKNIYLCGDYESFASINGAMASGRQTAEKIIQKDGK